MTNCRTYHPRFERGRDGDIWQMGAYGCTNYSALLRRGDDCGLLTPEKLEQLVAETELEDAKERARIETMCKRNDTLEAITRGEFPTM
jgi:hypothetical protein